MVTCSKTIILYLQCLYFMSRGFRHIVLVVLSVEKSGHGRGGPAEGFEHSSQHTVYGSLCGKCY